MSIPTAEQHEASLRRVWRISLTFAGLQLLACLSVLLFVLFSRGNLQLLGIVSTVLFQILLVSFGIGFSVPAVMASMAKLSLTLEIGRESLELGRKSANSLVQLQSEFVPVLQSLKTGITNLTDLVEKVKHGNGELKDTVRKAVSEARGVIKEGESHVEKFIFEKIDQFLSGAFTPTETKDE